MGLRFNADGFDTIYFVSTTVINFQHVLTIPNVPEILIRNLEFYRNKYSFKINGYVIMPHHIHSLFHINGKTCISDIMRDFKKYTSAEVRDYLNKTKSPFYPILAAEGRKVGQKFKLWMDRSDKVVIVTEKVLTTKLKYIHENPVRAGLVYKAEDYLYSSAKDYLTNDKGPLRIDHIKL